VPAVRGWHTMRSTMGVTIEIAAPGLLPDLVVELSANGCMTRAMDERVCRVVHLHAVDAAEEWYELRFFLRAWEVRNGVEVTLRPDWQRDGADPDESA
jgi:hypothetical protein